MSFAVIFVIATGVSPSAFAICAREETPLPYRKRMTRERLYSDWLVCSSAITPPCVHASSPRGCRSRGH